MAERPPGARHLGGPGPHPEHRLGGSLRVASEPGAGTTVYLEVPA
ncbi:hypothetical protein AB0M95_21180 [Sphaerisporangium sp. NPDC051017]